MSDDLFRRGLLAGLVGLGAVVAIGAAARRLHAAPPGILGLVLSGATVVVMVTNDLASTDVAIAIAGLAAAGLVVDLGAPLAVAPLLAAPAAWWLATEGGLADVTWHHLAVGAVAAIGGAAVASFDRRWQRHNPAPALFALSVVGVYFTVPDTEQALVLLGVVLPLSLAGWPVRLAALGAGGAMASTGLLAWVVAEGGWGRQSAIVGGMACLGLLAAEPLWRLFRARAGSPLDLLHGRAAFVPVVASVHLGVVFFASRVVGARNPVPHRRGEPLARGEVAESVVLTLVGAAVLLAMFGVVRLVQRTRS